MRGEESFLDSDIWKELAKAAGIRLPQWGTPCSTGKMKWYLDKIGRSADDYYAYHSVRNFRVFTQLNPEWPLRAWLGIELEIAKEQSCQKNLPQQSGPVSARPLKRATTKTSS